jgi:hypothetical protein
LSGRGEAGPPDRAAPRLYSSEALTLYPRLPAQFLSKGSIRPAMRAETQNLVDEIKQAISLLRRHL